VEFLEFAPNSMSLNKINKTTKVDNKKTILINDVKQVPYHLKGITFQFCGLLVHMCGYEQYIDN